MKPELLAIDGSRPAKAAEIVSLDGARSVADVFGRLLRDALSHWRINQVAALAGQDEAVHQMRVAVRRVKTLFDLFKPYIPETGFDSVRRELTRIGRTLGAARDWDVFMNGTLASAGADRPTRGAARAVAALALPIRRKRHRKIAEMIEAPPYSAFLLLMERRWLSGMKRNSSAAIAVASPDLLDRQARKAFAAGKGIAVLSAGQRHELRKKLKKLNDSVEFVGGLHGALAARRYSKRINRVLDVLGNLNDLAMAEKCLVRATGGTSTPTRIARPLRKRWRHVRAKQLACLPKVWRRLKKAELFWRNRRRADDTRRVAA